MLTADALFPVLTNITGPVRENIARIRTYYAPNLQTLKYKLIFVYCIRFVCICFAPKCVIEQILFAKCVHIFEPVSYSNYKDQYTKMLVGRLHVWVIFFLLLQNRFISDYRYICENN